MTDKPFTKLIAAGSDPADRTVSLAIAHDDMTGIVVNLSIELAGQLIAILAAEAGKVNGGIPQSERAAIPLKVHSVFLSQSQLGNPMIVFEMEGGTPLPLELQTVDLAGLSAEMGLLAADLRGKAN